MKKVIFLLLSACLLAGMPSCKRAIDKLMNDTAQSPMLDKAKDISDIKTLDEVKETLISKCDNEKMPVYSISLYEIEELSGKALFAVAAMVDAERTQTYSQNFGFDGDVSALETSIEKPDVTPIDMKSLDMGMIIKGIENAKSLIPEGYTFKTVRNMIIKDGKTRISLAVTKDGEETITNAGQTSEVYYEANYDIDNATGVATDKN